MPTRKRTDSRPLQRAGASCPTASQPAFRTDTLRWARSLTAMPAWVIAVAHDLTLAQAERVQAVVAELVAQDEAGR